MGVDGLSGNSPNQGDWGLGGGNWGPAGPAPKSNKFFRAEGDRFRPRAAVRHASGRGFSVRHTDRSEAEPERTRSPQARRYDLIIVEVAYLG